MRRESTLLIVLGLSLSLASVALGEDFTVNTPMDTVDAMPGDGVCADANGACSLRAAVMEANARFGPDVIYLPDMTYPLQTTGISEDLALTGDLDVLDNLTIIGASRTGTIIDGLMADRVLDLHAFIPSASVELRHLTIRNGMSSPGESGGAVRSQLGILHLDDVRIDGCASEQGGGIYTFAGTLIMSGCVVSECNASIDGGAVFNLGIAVIENTLLTHNSAMTRGGAIQHRAGSLTLRNETSFVSNESGSSGGGLHAQEGFVTLADCTFSFNSSLTTLGGAVSSDGATINAAGCTFEANAAPIQGGAVDLQSTAQGAFSDCTFSANTAGSGGAIRAQNGMLQLDQCGFDHNMADLGGAVTVLNSSLITSASTFTDNQATGDGGAILSSGGAIFAYDSAFESNVAANIGAVSVNEGFGHFERTDFVGNTAQTGGGGAIQGTLSAVTAIDCLFVANHAATEGGAIGSANWALDAQRCDFIDNDAADGGAIYNRSTTVAVDCTFFDNEASGDGGAVHNDVDAFSFEDCHFEHNVASNGGGIYVDQHAVSLSRCRFIDNLASGEFGGALYNRMGTVDADDCLFRGNTALFGGAVRNEQQVNCRRATFENNFAATGGGAVSNVADLLCVNATFFGNVGHHGGAIHNEATGGFAFVTLLNCTVTNNQSMSLFTAPPARGPLLGGVSGALMTPVGPAGAGGGFYNDMGTLVFGNTILADNGDANCVGPGSVQSLGHNIDTDGSCQIFGNNDLSNVPALVGPLADNGGFVPTCALLADSPAIDSGNDAIAPLVDARGAVRPEDGDGDGVFSSDRGAFESETIDVPDPSPFGVGGDECVDAGVICPGGPALGNTIGATGTPFSCGVQFGVLDVWCRYEPQTSGPAAVSVQGPPQTWLYEVWRDCPGGGGVKIGCGVSPTSATFNAVGGETYYVRIAATGFNEGQFQVTVIGPSCN